MRYTIETQNDRAEAEGWENAKYAAAHLLKDMNAEPHEYATITNSLDALAWIFPDGKIVRWTTI